MAKKFKNPFHRPRAVSEQAVVNNVLVGDDGVMRADEEVANVDDVMRKYDRESNTRIWTGVPKVVVSVLMAAFSIYCICMTLFSTALAETKLSLFLGFIILIGFMIYPANKKHVRPNHIPWYDIVLAVVGAACFFYFAANALTIIKLVTRIQPMHVIMGVVGILVLAELCRRCVGLPILVVVGALLIYAFYNQLSYNPDLYQGLRTIVYRLFYTTNGVIGTPVNVCFTYIVLFIIFGAFLERTGIAAFFISFANRIAGWSSGGAAKVSVISSALCGMVSGSSVGNTVTTGSITIPMMKKTGYKPEFAGAVEAASSTGGRDHAPHHGCGGLPHGRVHGHPLHRGRGQGHPACHPLLCRHLHHRAPRGQEARAQGHPQERAAQVVLPGQELLPRAAARAARVARGHRCAHHGHLGRHLDHGRLHHRLHQLLAHLAARARGRQERHERGRGHHQVLRSPPPSRPCRPVPRVPSPWPSPAPWRALSPAASP